MTARKSRPANYPSLADRADHYDLEKCAEQGFLLPDVSAVALEEILLANDLDLMSRARLLGYYSKNSIVTQRNKNADNKLNHILWFVNNAPNCKFVGDIYFEIDRAEYPKQYTEVKAAWTRQIQGNPASFQIKINAALFSFKAEPAWSKRLALSVLRQDANNNWAIRILKSLDKANKKRIKLPTVIVRKGIDIEKWRQQADKCYLSTLVFNGERMPPLSAETLEAVLAKYPDDISARAELMGFYYGNGVRANHLGVDPDCLYAFLGHLLWCIAYIPGSKFVGSWWRASWIDETFPEEYAVILDAWKQTLKYYANDAAVLASAGAFFSRFGQPALSKQLLQRAKKIRTNDKGVDYIFRYGVDRRQPFKKDVTTKVKCDVMNGIATDIGTRVKFEKVPFRKKFSLAEWSSEVELGRAHLAGAYHWVPARSIANLDELMPHNSPDMYNRAKIIGSYSKYYSPRYPNHDLAEPQYVSHLRHVLWFIERVPACQFIGLFKSILTSLKKYRLDSFKAVEASLLKALTRHKNDPRVVVNVATAFSDVNKAEARRISRLGLKDYPASRKQIQRILGSTKMGVISQHKLSEYEFVAGKRVRRLAKAARQLDLVQLMFGLGGGLAARTLWSNEQVLKRNPSDLILRAELLNGYNSSEEFHLYFNGYSPDCAKRLVKHNLWFIQNIPDYYLYSSGCEVTNDGGFGRSLGEHAVLLEAAKLQLKQYPEDLSVGLGLCHYFPLDHYRDSLPVLRKLQKIYPVNKALAKRLSHVEEMVARDKETTRRVKRKKQAKKDNRR